MEVIKTPPEIHTAFNPIVFSFANNLPSDVSISISDLNEPTAPAVVLSKKQFNGFATIEISQIVKNWFRNVVTVSPSSPRLLYDHLLFVDYKVSYVTGEEEWQIEPSILKALNAVVQIGESSDFTARRGQFLTGFERIKLYEGFPCTVSLLNFEEGATIGTSIRFTPVGVLETEPHITVTLQYGEGVYLFIANSPDLHYLETNDYAIITNNLGEPIEIIQTDGSYIEKRIMTDNLCTPRNPFWVRWINRLGGWDYFMFSHRQTRHGEMKTGKTFSPVVLDQQTASTFTEVLSIEAEEEITVGATGLTENEFEQIGKLIYSPKIEYYDREKEAWFSIISDKNEFDKDTYEATQSIELTFLLPEIQTQF